MRNLKIFHINPRSIYASRCHNKLDELAVIASVHDLNILIYSANKKLAEILCL